MSPGSLDRLHPTENRVRATTALGQCYNDQRPLLLKLPLKHRDLRVKRALAITIGSHHSVACLLQHLVHTSAKAAPPPQPPLRLKIQPIGLLSLLEGVPETHVRRLTLRVTACTTGWAQLNQDQANLSSAVVVYQRLTTNASP